MSGQCRIVIVMDDDSRPIQCVAEFLPLGSPYQDRPWRLSRRHGSEPLNVGDVWVSEEDLQS